eukprot:TRINITY_DN1965_c0_g1_i10.p1 TRINITY_DN1965_c0_g1~~TRINITY_DN1965_c0_g1_i10.p1  ORF type:complete len:193 (-),score=55.27 TRINITY_DN1965_c0_g1_i10:172-750(-)
MEAVQKKRAKSQQQHKDDKNNNKGMGGPGLINGKSVQSTDNFYPVKFSVDGVEFYSSENYFQCKKCLDPIQFEKVRKSGCGADVWRAGSMVNLRPDWEMIKVREMYIGNKEKFVQNEDIKQILLETSGPVVFRASTSFWCKWNGRIVELVREEMREEGKRDTEKIKEIWGYIEKYEEKQKKLMEKDGKSAQV